MKTAIVIFPGINRERDMARAVKTVSGSDPVMVWHQETSLPKCDVAIVPGGFSFGDYLRCGAIAAQSPIMADIAREADKGLTVIGICNGFQILTEARLLPGSLLRNRDLRFLCKDTYLRVERADTRFTRAYEQGQVLCVPIAHGEGNYFADEDELTKLEGEGQVLFRYCEQFGTLSESGNPNGSINHIAGVMNQAGNVFGMMPHPEDLIDPTRGGTDGRALFESVLERAA